ncbi:DUF484 family protein [Paraglaciecola arctica]|uniref:DUF484 family protein n=1 Tax=Paraglaciecola arctica BSs20135 TaxID=493475 RepID=K6Y7T8_9ALTE|nr:DUF484 family protein [Paraglaciecola arctica]GAC20026.1 hypothetical protein GARC_3063 [Paraglaciecola arctica BSs20135]
MDITTAYESEELLDAEQVVAYLLENPDFFAQYPQIIEKISIPHPNKGSVSLVELQSEQLRKKVRSLSHKLNQLISIAKQNEAIYRVYADLNLRILKCTNLDDLKFILEEVIQENLQLASVTLKPFKGAHALPEIQQRLFIEKRFKRDKFFFGRLSEHERKLLFADQEANSVALLLIGDLGELGILAIGSKNPGHFNPDMDTLLITQLQQFLGILLPKLLTY